MNLETKISKSSWFQADQISISRTFMASVIVGSSSLDLWRIEHERLCAYVRSRSMSWRCWCLSINIFFYVSMLEQQMRYIIYHLYVSHISYIMYVHLTSANECRRGVVGRQHNETRWTNWVWGKQLYKCACLLYLLWCIHLKSYT